jgi:PKD repeat protein
MKIMLLVILPALAVVLLHFGLAGARQAPSVETTWGPNVRANSDTGSASQHEPSLAISRTDPNVVVVAKDYRHNDSKEVWIYVSQDGGQTWPAEKQLQVPGLPADIPNQSDPVAVARDDGRMYVICLGHNDGHGLFLTWSDDNGDTWVDAVPITHNETPYGLDDKEWLAIDNNPASPYYHRMYVAWAAGGILFKRSVDGGQTWSSYQNIAPGDTEYPFPVVAADGSLYVFYMENRGFCYTGTVRYVKSTNGGVTFTVPYTVATAYQPCSLIHYSDQFRFFSIITAAADPNDADNLWVAWTDDHNVDNGPTDVLYTRSVDGGLTWSTPGRLSHDPAGNGKDHITPVFAIGADSRLHAFWLDRRDDPNNVLFHAYHSSTTDGGLTWEEDNRVSEQSFDLNLYLPPPTGYNAAGDYWGLDTEGDIVMAAWNTTVETSQDIYVARGILAPLGALTGQVVDAATTQPIEAAEVRLETGLSAFTGPDGVYHLDVVSGTYIVTAQASGYFSHTVPDVEVLTGTVILDFDLEPAVCPLPEILSVNVLTDGLTVTFSVEISSSLPVSYTWTFGDGLTSTLAAPVHAYADYGTYPVTLTVTTVRPDGGTCGSAVWSGQVVLIAPPKELYFPLML